MIDASEFEARCRQLIDEVDATGETLTVTKDGKPVVEVRPAVRSAMRERKSLWGLHAGQGEILGDIIGPVFEDDWEALR
jgi:antitoxin (DNA-binding transcriptional repressor) of toxin-antitoxin stability system